MRKNAPSASRIWKEKMHARVVNAEANAPIPKESTQNHLCVSKNKQMIPAITRKASMASLLKCFRSYLSGRRYHEFSSKLFSENESILSTVSEVQHYPCLYDLSNISEPDAVRYFIASTNDDDPTGSYLDFQVIHRHELAWWVRVGEEA
jgi:hypothetical protein